MENRMINEAPVSQKNDRKDDKLMWELLPLDDIEDVVKVYTEGAKKYGPNNWQHLENGYQRYKAAMLRHLLEYEKGHEFDEETGCRHLAQVVWNAIAMLHISKHPCGNVPTMTDILESFYKRPETEDIANMDERLINNAD